MHEEFTKSYVKGIVDEIKVADIRSQCTDVEWVGTKNEKSVRVV